MIPFLFALTFSILFTLVFFIAGLFLLGSWINILGANGFNTGDMKVPTFYSTKEGRYSSGYVFFSMSAAGVVFGGIHCAGWFFYFPSSDEAILWRVSSAVLTGIAFLLPLLAVLHVSFRPSNNEDLWDFVAIAVSTITLLVYVVSRLLLLVEAFISLRHLTPGMLALVKWTSFIPHI